MKFFITTFGCQANERDSETIAGLLQNMGYEQTEQPLEADIHIFNTCCVREKAENKVLSQVGELKVLKEQNPDLIIGICGCMVQQEGMTEKIRQRAPHVDLIFGTHNIGQLPELITNIQKTKQAQVSVLPDTTEVVEGLPAYRQYPFKALINITYGCNNFCTYCIVPYVRGREKSRKPEDILTEIRQLTEEGVVEVLLLGQNVNAYGKNLDNRCSFGELLKQVNEIPKLKRIRYLTSHPRDFHPDLVHLIAGLKKVCPHFHLPVQSGSNQILRRMNRGYTREEYLAIIETIQQQMPHASITTDLIVGFPGETETDFLDTLDLVQKARFDSAFTFLYSPRSGTPAAQMKEQIPLAVKKERLQRLMTVQNEISLAKNQALVGQVVEILVEGASKKNQAILEGRTDTNKTVLFPGTPDLIGKFCKVKINTAQTWVLKAELQQA
jgi:tRNA-2-methylthio-N6-dimethylallyladenosine synthase